MANNRLRQFLTGKNGLLLSDANYKTAVLRGHLALVGLTVSLSYIGIDHLNGIYGNEPYYIVTAVFSLATVFLNRAGKHKAASILFVAVLNVIVFLFSASDTYRSGIYVYFVVTSLTAFALFGYKDRVLAFSFTFLSLAFFMYSYLGDHAIMPKRVFTEGYLQINFTTNFVVAQATSIAIVYFLIEVNFQSEKQTLSKNDQLAKANAELDRFVYSASHDLRAPLSSILGLVNLYNLTDSEEERHQVVGLIQDRVNKLDNFIREILDYSRNARLQIRTEAVNGPLLVKEVMEGLRYSPGFEKIKIELHAADPVVHTDPERLKVILNNLLANSLKYHDHTKSQPFIRIRFSKEPETWNVVVEDNGQGIHPNHHDRIFEMFYRAHETSEGSGLGLYIVKEVVERMGGAVSVHSQLGDGSVFQVTFPNQPVTSL